MRKGASIACLCALPLVVALSSGRALAEEAKAGAKEQAKPSGGVDPKRTREHETYSPYEKTTIDGALAKLEAEMDPDPEGKIIERIDIVTLEVIEDRDPAPRFLNVFHVTSREYVIEREILTRVGDPYRKDIVDETARRLRAIDQLSLVLCFGAKGSRPDRVRLVVITKDVWSLRLNSGFRFAGGRLETLLLQPSEENLFGTHSSVAVQFTIDPATYALGGRFAMRRIAGQPIRFLAEANIIINRSRGEAEGSYGTFSYGQPLYSTKAEWAWGATIVWRDEMFRRYCPYDGVTPCSGDLRAFDAEATPEVDGIPFSYRSEQIVAQDFVTRSFGRLLKNDITLGVEISRRHYRAKSVSSASPAAVAEFNKTVLPLSDTRVGPYIEYHTYSTRYKHALDFETLGLTEDVNVGHDVTLKIAPVSTSFGASRSYVHVAAAARYALPIGDGMVVGFAESTTDIAASSLPDAAIEAGGRIVTPRLGFGRLVFDGRVVHLYRNYLNRTWSLGGNTRLRGYPTQAFLGKDVVAANLELRSRPVEVLACQLGGVAFFDVGDAWNGTTGFALKQSAGFGLRILFPQFDRVVLRADWGFPLTRGYREPDALPGDIVVTLGQAFDLPELPTDPGIE